MDIDTKFIDFCKNYQGPRASQIKQDLFVMAMLDSKKSGYFVEFGAMDGLYFSNTVVLEKHLGWQGIISEPGKVFKDKISTNRNCIIDYRAVSSHTGQQLEFKETEVELGLSGLTDFFDSNEMHTRRRSKSAGDIYQVETVSLNDLLQQHRAPNRIDYMSIDTEGSEHAILEKFDFDRHRVSIFTIEHNHVEDKKQAIRNIMTKNGYEVVAQSHSKHDDWFIDRDLL